MAEFDKSLIPVMRHHDWRYLLRDLTNSSYRHSLSGITSRSLVRALLAPAAAARAIAVLAPDLMQREHLNILIAGAEFQDTTDDGQWYQLIPWLLGRPALKVDVTLVGLQIDEPEGIPPWEMGQFKVRPGLLKPAEKFNQHFSDFLNAHDGRYDLICFFNPGFGGCPEWYEEDVLRRLMQVGDIVLGSSFGPTEVPDDLFMAKLFGIEQIGETIENPFSVRSAPDITKMQQSIADLMGDTDWGCVLWRVALQSDTNPHAALFVQGLEILDANIQAGKDHSGLDGMNNFQEQLKYVGVRADIPPEKSLPEFPLGHRIIMSLENHIIDAETGQFYDGGKDRFVDNIVPADLLAAYPEAALEPLHPLPLVLWSLAVWYRCMVQNKDNDEELQGAPFDEEKLGDILKSMRGAPDFKTDMMHSLGRLLGEEYDDGMVKQFTEAIFGKEKRTISAIESPIIDAYKSGEFTKALELIAANPKLVDAMDESWVTGLYYAASADDEKFASALLKLGASYNHRDGEGWTPLMYAAYHNATSVMKVLLHAGAEPDAQSPVGFTPLHFAVSRGAEHAAMLLLEFRAGVDIQCAAGYTVRDLAQSPETPKGPLRDRVLAAKR